MASKEKSSAVAQKAEDKVDVAEEKEVAGESKEEVQQAPESDDLSTLNPGAVEFVPAPKTPKRAEPLDRQPTLTPQSHELPMMPASVQSPTMPMTVNFGVPGSASVTPMYPRLLPFDNEQVLQNLIRAQIEYFFSDFHLTNDTFLLARLGDDPERYIPVSLLCKSPRIKALTTREDRVVRALESSVYLELSPDKRLVRRPGYSVPQQRQNKDLRRTVFLYGIPARRNTEDEVMKLVEDHGTVRRVHLGSNLHHDLDAPERAVSLFIMQKKFSQNPSDRDFGFGDDDAKSSSDEKVKKSTRKSSSSSRKGKKGGFDSQKLYAHPVRNPNGNPNDFSHLFTAFVVFDSQSQANKCVKGRMRAVDGIRAIHKYDYLKVAKRYKTATMKGETLQLSPPPSPKGLGVIPGPGGMRRAQSHQVESIASRKKTFAQKKSDQLFPGTHVLTQKDGSRLVGTNPYMATAAPAAGVGVGVGTGVSGGVGGRAHGPPYVARQPGGRYRSGSGQPAPYKYAAHPAPLSPYSAYPHHPPGHPQYIPSGHFRDTASARHGGHGHGHSHSHSTDHPMHGSRHSRGAPNDYTFMSEEQAVDYWSSDIGYPGSAPFNPQDRSMLKYGDTLSDPDNDLLDIGELEGPGEITRHKSLPETKTWRKQPSKPPSSHDGHGHGHAHGHVAKQQKVTAFQVMDK